MLANLRDCLHFMKQLANHVLEYIDTATTGTLTPHLIPVPDLQKMLCQIESELPPNMHLPIPSSDPLHFYRYLRSHVLVEESQFLMASSGWFLSLEIISRTMFFCLLNRCIGLFSVPRLMCVEMIHECLVGYAARIG